MYNTYLYIWPNFVENFFLLYFHSFNTHGVCMCVKLLLFAKFNIKNMCEPNRVCSRGNAGHKMECSLFCSFYTLSVVYIITRSYLIVLSYIVFFYYYYFECLAHISAATFSFFWLWMNKYIPHSHIFWSFLSYFFFFYR